MACFGTYVGALHNKTSISTMYVGRDNVTGVLCLQKQIAKLVSGLLYSWSLLCNNNRAINLRMFTLSYAGILLRVTRAPSSGVSKKFEPGGQNIVEGVHWLL